MIDDALEVGFKFVAMLGYPFSHEPQRSSRQRTSHNGSGCDFYLGGFVTVASVEMGRRVVPVVHPDHDSEEAAYARHCGESFIGFSFSTWIATRQSTRERVSGTEPKARGTPLGVVARVLVGYARRSNPSPSLDGHRQRIARHPTPL
ncbi:MAG TPA: hypothetical protein VIM28_05535 [Solirubrobacterales bacterium]